MSETGRRTVGRGTVGRGAPRARRRGVLGAAAGAAGAAGLLGAGAPAAGAQSPMQDELRIVSARIAPGLDPTHEFSDAVATYMRAAGAAEALLRITPDADVDVDLASAFEMLDPNTWRVTLSPNATFWSGHLGATLPPGGRGGFAPCSTTLYHPAA